VLLKLHVAKKPGNSEGGSAGIFCFLDFRRRSAKISTGLNSISSLVAIERKISFSREIMRLKVSRPPALFDWIKLMLQEFGPNLFNRNIIQSREDVTFKATPDISYMIF